MTIHDPTSRDIIDMALRRVRAAVVRYRPQDSADLDSLIRLGQKEAGMAE